MFGINGAEVLVLLVVALVVVGPERLPAYAEQLATWTRSLRTFVSSAKDRVATELGEEAQEVDWASLDPRRYDPRRIVREALLDEPGPPPAVTGRTYSTARTRTGSTAAGAQPGAGGERRGASAGPAPFDDEAT